MKIISSFIILTVFVLFIFACKSSKTITQNEQTDIIEINDYFFDTIEENISDTIEENILIDFFEEQALFGVNPQKKHFLIMCTKTLFGHN